jgi:hypothetical protein
VLKQTSMSGVRWLCVSPLRKLRLENYFNRGTKLQTMRLEGFSIKRGHGVPAGFSLSLRIFLSSKFFKSIGCSFTQITDHVSAV